MFSLTARNSALFCSSSTIARAAPCKYLKALQDRPSESLPHRQALKRPPPLLIRASSQCSDFTKDSPLSIKGVVSGSNSHHNSSEMGSLEAALEAIGVFVPQLTQGKHKGQAGKIAVIGGCREYTGAPYFAAISALKVGADLSHVFCSKDAAMVIKSYSPELIVHPVLRESWEAVVEGGEKKKLVEQVVADVAKWLPRFDCLVIGPGLGRDPLLLECVIEVIQKARKEGTPMVIDGDGLSIVTSDPELIRGYPLAILTPNVNEHKRLVAAVVNEDPADKPGNEDLPGQLKVLASRLGGVTIVQKGPSDYISDGNEVLEFGLFGSPRRCGGQGDVLSGTTAVFMAWARTFQKGQPEGSEDLKKVASKLSSNPAMAAAYAASLLVRRSAIPAYDKYKRSMVTGDLIEELGASMEELFPAGENQYPGPKL